MPPLKTIGTLTHDGPFQWGIFDTSKPVVFRSSSSPPGTEDAAKVTTSRFVVVTVVLSNSGPVQYAEVSLSTRLAAPRESRRPTCWG